MDQVMAAIEAELQQIPEIRPCWCRSAAASSAACRTADVYVRIAPHDERRFSLGRFASALLRGEPMAAFRGNYTQRDVMNVVQQRLRKLTDVRVTVSNQRSINLGGGPFPLDFAIRGPDLPTSPTASNACAPRR
jgi:HAE1 family hydrophobic/amphiphilic exporter-1